MRRESVQSAKGKGQRSKDAYHKCMCMGFLRIVIILYVSKMQNARQRFLALLAIAARDEQLNHATICASQGKALAEFVGLSRAKALAPSTLAAASQ